MRTGSHFFHAAIFSPFTERNPCNHHRIPISKGSSEKFTSEKYKRLKQNSLLAIICFDMRNLVVICLCFIVSDGFMRWSPYHVRLSLCIASADFTTSKMTTSPVAIDDNNDSAHQQQDHSKGESDEKEMLLLPAGKSDTDNNSTTTTQIQLDGDAVPLRELGPIIINRDGTTRRITNWHDLTPVEQESSWRVIAARNKRRIVALKRKQQEGNQQQQVDDGVQEYVDVTNENDASDAPQD